MFQYLFLLKCTCLFFYWGFYQLFLVFLFGQSFCSKSKIHHAHFVITVIKGHHCHAKEKYQENQSNQRFLGKLLRKPLFKKVLSENELNKFMHVTWTTCWIPLTKRSEKINVLLTGLVNSFSSKFLYNELGLHKNPFLKAKIKKPGHEVDNPWLVLESQGALEIDEALRLWKRFPTETQRNIFLNLSKTIRITLWIIWIFSKCNNE